VVLALGAALTGALALLAWTSAVDTARREFALDSLGLQTRVARSLSLLNDRVRILARPPLGNPSSFSSDPVVLREFLGGFGVVEQVAYYTGPSRPRREGLLLQRVVAVPVALAVSAPEAPATLDSSSWLHEAAIASFIENEVMPASLVGRLALVQATCVGGAAPVCPEVGAVVAFVSLERLLKSLQAGPLAVVLDAEAGGLLGRQRIVATRGSDARVPLAHTHLEEVARVPMPGYTLRLALSADMPVLRSGGGLLLTALLVGGGATLLLIAVVRARSAQLQLLAERNDEISRQVEAQTRELSTARDAALAAARVKAEFLATMSHEIRTPLNAIMGLSELLAESRLSVEQQHYVEMHRRASENLLGLLNDVLDLSKAEAGQLRLAREPFCLRELCEQAVDLFALRAAEKGLCLYAHLDPALPERVLGDAPRLKQVLCNLLGNAVKFTDRGEVGLEVRPVATAEAPDRVLFQVVDTGMGVPADQLEAVFGSFAQVDGTPGRRHGGTGLGLSISRELVDRMDGRLWLSSELGVGSVFHAEIALPPVSDGLSPTAPLAASAELDDVLIIEPSERLRAALAALVTSAGARHVRALGTATEASPPSLILARLPALEELASSWPGVPRLALIAGVRLAATLRELQALGVERFVVQPAKRSDLLQPSCVTSLAAQDALPPVSPELERPQEDAAAGIPLLLVDDSADNRLLVQAFLKGRGWAIAEAVDGASAVEAAASGRYAVILMDIQMPGMDGYAATRAIREAEAKAGRRPARILALTAHTAQEDLDRTLAAGCDAYLGKPLRKAALLAELARLSSAGDSSGA
jgi:signal transduction histidine kinase/CheY-like chemotaxis protein